MGGLLVTVLLPGLYVGTEGRLAMDELIPSSSSSIDGKVELNSESESWPNRGESFSGCGDEGPPREDEAMMEWIDEPVW